VKATGVPPTGSSVPRRSNVFADRFAKHFAVEIEVPRKSFKIIEVFHSAVGDPELDHGLEFFRNNGFFGIGEKAGIGGGSNVRYWVSTGAGVMASPNPISI
jgi:hypothetical protein